MSADLQKSLETAIARIAQLEAEVSRSRKPATPPPPAFDEAAFARAMTADPIGVMRKLGVPVEHVTRVAVAHAMGDQAPAELKVLAQMGPQMSATSALNSTVESLRQRLDGYEAKDRRESIKKLAADKSKYPHLAKALGADSSMFDVDADGHRGSPEEFATAMEARLNKLVPAIAPQPASANAADPQAQSTQSVAQGGIDPTPPPIPQSKPGVFTNDDHAKLKDEIIRKYSQVTPP